MVGVRVSQITDVMDLFIENRRIRRADTFCDVGKGELFWYENSNGLVEIAANSAKASDILQISLGTEIKI